MARRLVCIDDFEQEAKKIMDGNHRDFICSGADGEVTLADNREAFRRIKLLPRVLRHYTRDADVSSCVLGQDIALPVGICPSMSQNWLQSDGDVCSARAAADQGVPFITGICASCSLEHVAKCCPNGIKWFQIFTTTDIKFNETLVRRAENAGYNALVWTVDGSPPGVKREVLRSGFDLCNNIGAKYPNFEPILPHKAFPADVYESALNWDTFHWMQKLTKLPIIIKGILNPRDALLAAQHGASAIIVSNHGGRQLDGVPATIDMLPEISKAVGGKLEIYLDSGVRTGTDVLKALALGAKAVFIGRPVLYGLACDGQAGVKRVLEILKEELSLAMKLAGCSFIADINSDLVIRKYYYANL